MVGTTNAEATESILTVVKVKTGGPLGSLPMPLLVLAVDNRGTQIEFRTMEPTSVGDRFEVAWSQC